MMLRDYRSTSLGSLACAVAILVLTCIYAGVAHAANYGEPGADLQGMPAMGIIGLCVVAGLCALAGVFILLRKS